MKPIDNKTQLNTTLFTSTSSGAVDVIMPLYPEDRRDFKHSPYRSRQTEDRWWEYGPSINNWPPPIVQEKWEKVPIGDRHTLFLGPLFTNSYLINLEMLGLHKTVFVNFTTTRDHSFSLHHDGNRNLPFNITWGDGASLWRPSTVKNLEPYFDLLGEESLHFTAIIHKSNSYAYAVDLVVHAPEAAVHKIMYLSNGGHNTFVDGAVENVEYIFKELKDTTIRRRGQSPFKEWNTKPDGTGVSHNPKDKLLLTEDLTIYAIWGDHTTVP